MSYKFKSKESSDLTMLSPQGDNVLRLIGKAPAAQGILPAQSLPAAIEALQRAVAADELRRKEGASDDEGDEEAAAASSDTVSLRQRVWPLVEMMKRAHAAQSDIIWGA